MNKRFIKLISLALCAMMILPNFTVSAFADEAILDAAEEYTLNDFADEQIEEELVTESEAAIDDEIVADSATEAERIQNLKIEKISGNKVYLSWACVSAGAISRIKADISYRRDLIELNNESLFISKSQTGGVVNLSGYDHCNVIHIAVGFEEAYEIVSFVRNVEDAEGDYPDNTLENDQGMIVSFINDIDAGKYEACYGFGPVDEIGNYYYTGKAVTPAVRVVDGSKVLEEGVDYKISYGNNTKVSEVIDINNPADCYNHQVGNGEKIPYVKITGIGTYKGTQIVKYFNIIKVDLSHIPDRYDYEERVWVNNKSMAIFRLNGPIKKQPKYEMVIGSAQSKNGKRKNVYTNIPKGDYTVEYAKYSVSDGSIDSEHFGALPENAKGWYAVKVKATDSASVIKGEAIYVNAVYVAYKKLDLGKAVLSIAPNTVKNYEDMLLDGTQRWDLEASGVSYDLTLDGEKVDKRYYRVVSTDVNAGSKKSVKIIITPDGYAAGYYNSKSSKPIKTDFTVKGIALPQVYYANAAIGEAGKVNDVYAYGKYLPGSYTTNSEAVKNNISVNTVSIHGDFDVTMTNSKKLIGNHKVTVTGKGAYEGKYSFNLIIEPMTVSYNDIKGSCIIKPESHQSEITMKDGIAYLKLQKLDENSDPIGGKCDYEFQESGMYDIGSQVNIIDPIYLAKYHVADYYDELLLGRDVKVSYDSNNKNVSKAGEYAKVTLEFNNFYKGTLDFMIPVCKVTDFNCIKVMDDEKMITGDIEASKVMIKKANAYQMCFAGYENNGNPLADNYYKKPVYVKINQKKYSLEQNELMKFKKANPGYASEYTLTVLKDTDIVKPNSVIGAAISFGDMYDIGGTKLYTHRRIGYKPDKAKIQKSLEDNIKNTFNEAETENAVVKIAQKSDWKYVFKIADTFSGNELPFILKAGDFYNLEADASAPDTLNDYYIGLYDPASGEYVAAELALKSPDEYGKLIEYYGSAGPKKIKIIPTEYSKNLVSPVELSFRVDARKGNVDKLKYIMTK